jgi:hypothetical protein
MTLMPPCTASTNPGLPGFARFWGPAFPQTPLLGQRASDAARARLASKTFLQESMRARPDGSWPANGSDGGRCARNFPTGKFLGRRYFDAFTRVRRWLLKNPSHPIDGLAQPTLRRLGIRTQGGAMT